MVPRRGSDCCQVFGEGDGRQSMQEGGECCLRCAMVVMVCDQPTDGVVRLRWQQSMLQKAVRRVYVSLSLSGCRSSIRFRDS